MPTRIAFKREIQKAMKRSPVLLKCTAVLLAAGLAVPALMCAYETQTQHRLAMSRELHWKKWYSTEQFCWGNWPDERCQAITRFGRKALDTLVEVRCRFFLVDIVDVDCRCVHLCSTSSFPRW
jgi:hypothetical protein